jgi:nucleoside-diphosphate-sugar epimerase
MKTVVTGAAGFIGANLVRALIEQGREVRGVDSLSRGSDEYLKGLNLEVVHADLRDYRNAVKVLKGADVVFHLAARVGSIDYLHGSESVELETLQSNLAIDTNVFRACREQRVKRIVYSSSVSVYPIQKQERLGAKFREGDIHPVSPEGGYGWAKFLGEVQLEMMKECESAVPRIFNSYGPYSEFRKTAQVVPALVRKAIRYPKERFVVWGDGTATRNFLYVDDCVEALLQMEKHASFPPLVLNIGNPQTTTIKRLAEVVVKTSRKDIRPSFDPSKPAGPRSRVPDVNEARKRIGWKPKTSLEDGVGKTYRWMEKLLNPR